MNLYEITGNYLKVQEMLESGEYTPEELADTMEAIQGEFEDKADGYARIIRNMTEQTLSIEAEIDRLDKRRARLQDGITSLKLNLHASMIALDKRKFKTDLFSFNIAKNGGRAPIVFDADPDKLPDEFTKITRTPDKQKIAQYLEQNGTSDLFHYGERGEHLTIK